MPGPADLTGVLAVFASRMAGGYALCLGLLGASVRQGSWRKVSLFVIAGLSVVALASGAPPWPAAALAAAALLLERAIAFGVRGLSATFWILPFAAWLLLAAERFGLATLPGAVAAGGTLAAMLLGHSYLTARGLSFGPLQRMAWLLFGILLVRLATVVPAAFADGVTAGSEPGPVAAPGEAISPAGSQPSLPTRSGRCSSSGSDSSSASSRKPG